MTDIRDANPDDPVLKAIDRAKWDDEDLDTFNILPNCDRSNAILAANRQIEAIRKAYLANQKTAVEFAVETLNDTIERQDKRITELEADKAELVDTAKAKDDMLVCYRIGKQPSEKLFARLEKANLTIAKHGKKAGNEAQLPKAVTPRFTGTLGHKTCDCGNSVRVAARYCSNCGSKLNWEDA